MEQKEFLHIEQKNNVSKNDFNRIATFIKKEAGIDLSEKYVLVSTRLESFFSANGITDTATYLNMALVQSSKESEELINLLTTNHTFFWRENQHFEFMLSTVLPELKKKCSISKDMRIWCAASSTGEEPYTLAMAAMDSLGPDYHLWDTTVLATDISTKVLSRAQNGIYSADAIKDLPVNWQHRFFKKRGDIVEASDELKNRVIFRKLNLIEPYPFRKPLHVIFVRNVLIYFDEPTKRDIVKRMTDALAPGGYLFVGTTESISKLSDDLEYVQPSVYRKKQG